MSGKCDVCGKTVVFGHNVSHSNRKTNRSWAPNIQRRRVVIGDQKKRMNICTRCLRTQRKHAAASA